MDNPDQSDNSNNGLSSPRKGLSVFAPAKINLFLHLTGRRADGYHELQSLVGFADIGDNIQLQPTHAPFSFAVTGRFAGQFSPLERSSTEGASNLVTHAAMRLAESLKRDLRLSVTLEKNLPLAAGLGGGSSDAAATIWGLLEMWGISPQAVPQLDALMLGLGADVPACFACRPVVVEGIGEIVTPLTSLPEMPLLLVNPGIPCPTPAVFGAFEGDFTAPKTIPHSFTPESLLALMYETRNMLTEAACTIAPAIKDVLSAITDESGCQIARLSGSGATCFGLFQTTSQAEAAAENLIRNHPTWWVRAGTLNRPERY